MSERYSLNEQLKSKSPFRREIEKLHNKEIKWIQKETKKVQKGCKHDFIYLSCGHNDDSYECLLCDKVVDEHDKEYQDYLERG
mgnify:CR=1 FL=1